MMKKRGSSIEDMCKWQEVSSWLSQPETRTKGGIFKKESIKSETGESVRETRCRRRQR